MSLGLTQSLAGATITYNGVQFGGQDSNHQSVPPTYKFNGRFEYDAGGIAVKATVYTLTVSTTFYHNTSEGSLADVIESVRLKLQQPGKTLKIEGLGTAFGTITHDEEWGPKPLFFDWNPLGIYAWECVYVIQFKVKECESHNVNGDALSAFNFETTWQNDYEGICERTISGIAEIPIYRLNGGNIPQKVADQVRESLLVVCPTGFHRLRNVWREGYTKNQLAFVITDMMEQGTPLPVGCSMARGGINYQSSGPGFAQAVVNLNVDLRVSPGYHPSLAGAIFLTAAKDMQDRMQQNIGQGGIVVPKSIQIYNGKFRESRNTSANMSWLLTKCTANMMKAAGIWTPVVSNDFTQWRASIENLWHNRGAATLNGNVIGSDPAESVVVDLCQNVSSVVIGNNGVLPNIPDKNLNFQFTCPNIPEDGGWIYHDLKLKIIRYNSQTWHKKQVAYTPEPGYDGSSGTPISVDGVNLGSFPFEQASEETLNDVEYNGLPEHYILLQFRALRLKHKPQLPIIKTVGGLPVTEVTVEAEGPKVAYDTLGSGCPVWKMRGYRVYRVNGYIASIKAQESKTSCSAPDGDKKDY